MNQTTGIGTEADTILDIRALTKSYGSGEQEKTILHDVDLQIGRGEVVTIIGPSGCGKSTLLACMAGLVEQNSGTITSGERCVDGPGSDRVMVFQNASLLPWRTVRRNVAYGAEIARWPKKRRDARVAEAIRLVGLEGHEDHFPSQISGGMQQRTNLARALVMEAEVILMDEPFGALDAITRRGMQDELLNLHRTLGRTIVFITHDIDEAIYLADRVVVMGARPGRIIHEELVPFPRPRHRDVTNTPEFRAMAAKLDSLLHVPAGT